MQTFEIKMADLRQDSCANIPDGNNESNITDQMVKRGPPTSPNPSPPHKKPCTQSPPSTTRIPSAPEGVVNTERDMPEETVEGNVPSEGPSQRPPAQRKSWRRVTLGRRSLPALPNPSQELCRSISPSLPPQERLEKLMKASMRLALERTQTMLQSTPNASLELFQKQAEEMQQEGCRLADEIRHHRQAQQLPASKEIDTAMQRALEQTRSAIHRLQTESECWEALLNKHRSKAEALASKVEQGKEYGVTLDPTSLARSSQYRLIQGKPDYHSVLSRQQPALHSIELVMEDQCKMVKALLCIQEHSQLLVKETSVKLAAEAGFQDLSPDLLRNLVAVPLSSATS